MFSMFDCDLSTIISLLMVLTIKFCPISVFIVDDDLNDSEPALADDLIIMEAELA